MQSAGLIVFSGLLVFGFSAPVIYDQRQDGNLNIHADLENFLIVIATNSKSSDFGLMGSLALQHLMEARQKFHQTQSIEYKPEGSSSHESKEPYSVEILKLSEEDEKKVSRPTAEHAQDQAKPVFIQENTKTIVPADEVFKKDVDTSKTLELKVMNLSRRRSEHHQKHEAVRVKGIHEDSVSVPLPVDKEVDNEKEKKVRSGEEGEEIHPIKLIGDGIEDCGPGRSRNKLGICQADEQVD